MRWDYMVLIGCLEVLMGCLEGNTSEDAEEAGERGRWVGLYGVNRLFRGDNRLFSSPSEEAEKG